MDDITPEEWHHTVFSLSDHSAADPSKINYRIIKKLPEDMVSIFIRFINFTLKTGRIPAL